MALLLLLLLGGCLAQEPPYYQDHTFSYSVEDDSSGNQFGHSETSHAGSTAGAYHVLLPDGRLQTVEYTVDRHAGFQARVQYQGLAVSPRPREVYQPVERPAYSPAPTRPTPNPGYPTQHYAALTSPAPHYAALTNPAPPYHPPHPPTTTFTAFGPSQQTQHFYVPQEESRGEFYSFPAEASAGHPVIYRPPGDTAPVIYRPHSYAPAPVTQYDPHVHNLLVAAPIHPPNHAPRTAPRVTPLTPPEHHKEDEVIKADPYLMSEEDLKTHDFSGPFWYPHHTKILRLSSAQLRKNRKEKQHMEDEVSHNHL